MAGPPPKRAAERRRSRSRNGVQIFDPEGPDAIPALPRKQPAWLKATRDYWERIWQSPMATAWIESDLAGLIRLAQLVELANRGNDSAALLSETRQLEDRFGLSPLARRRLEWEISESPSGRTDGRDGERSQRAQERRRRLESGPRHA